MFFTGDLQSGIALALRESKSVACFVADDGEESVRWENDYLKDPQVTSALRSKSVALRIQAGSQEAGFLAAYYPVPQVPSLMIIHNGQLTLQLYAGEAQHTFKAEVLKTLSAIPSTEPNATPQSDSNSNTNINTATPNAQPRSIQGPATAPSPAVEVSAAPVPATSSTNSSSNTASSNPRPSAVESLLADRRRKLEMDKKEKDAAENAERKAKADARKAAVTSDPDSAKGKQATYAQQQRQRNHEAKLEKERILRQIEQDKVERREKIEREKALAREEARVKAEGSEADEDPKDGAGGLVDKQLRFESSSNPVRSRYCAVQVRLFDGSTVRNKFPSDLILRTTVRTWIEEQRSDGDAPYTLKHILTPLPNKTLSISDEEQSLQDLGFDPSATLVMVPVQGYTAAYAGNPGLVSRGASVGYSVVSSGAGMIAGALGTFLGLGQATPQTGVEETPTQQENIQPCTESRSSASSSNINVRTLHDQRDDPHDHQLYNGNQLNFEPRRDDPDDRD